MGQSDAAVTIWQSAEERADRSWCAEQPLLLLENDDGLVDAYKCQVPGLDSWSLLPAGCTHRPAVVATPQRD